jgi:hypothetical protein
MPFTPFHMGAAMVVKPIAVRKFSVIAFGLAQIIIDVEPGIGMLQGASVLHGPSHTVLGALLIAGLTYLITPWLSQLMLLRWNQELRFHKLTWLVEKETVNSGAIAVGALYGTFSHLLLDSLMHDDIQPLAPFSQANPLLHIVSHDDVYVICTALGLIGLGVWIELKWRNRMGDQ